MINYELTEKNIKEAYEKKDTTKLKLMMHAQENKIFSEKSYKLLKWLCFH